MPKYEMRKEENLEDILNRYLNNIHGYGGISGEIIGRKTLTDKIERLHPAGYGDCIIKRGVSVEFKTGAGELEPFGFDTKEEAEEAMENDDFLRGCTHVAYLAKFDGTNVEDFIVLSRKRFIKVLKAYNLVRVKKASNGKWKVTIQNYLPTPNFHPSLKRAACFFEALEENGYYLDIFAERMVNRDLYL